MTLAARAGRMLMVGVNRRYAPVYVAAREAFAERRPEACLGLKNGPGTEYRATLVAVGPGRPTRAALALLVGYQRWLSPLLPGACRFWPTCSEYARLALLRHGLVRGGALALWRLCRCHRFARGGLDPPP